jgi:hypothetical protein
MGKYVARFLRDPRRADTGGGSRHRQVAGYDTEVSPNQLHTWERQFEERPNSASSGEGRRRGEETKVAELERKIGQQAMEIDLTTADHLACAGEGLYCGGSSRSCRAKRRTDSD